MVLLGFIAAKISEAPEVVATIGVAVTVVSLIIGHFKRSEFSMIDPRVTKAVIAVVLIVDFGVSVGWGAGWPYYQANRTIDVLSEVTLAKNIGILPYQRDHATLDATVTETRDTIVLVFQIDDHNPHIGNCRPNTLLSVTRDKTGNPGETVFASHGVATLVDLPAGSRKIHLDIAVTNTRGDRNCRVDLRVTSATLRNK